MCKISVIMPAFNCAQFIGQAIDSVLNQSEKDLELIVINDGSTDKTLDAVSAKRRDDSRVKVVSQSNSGKPSIVRNTGLHMAKGEHIAFLDGDDLYQLDKLENCLNAFKQHPELDMVFHDVFLMDAFGNKHDTTYLESVGFDSQVLSKSNSYNNNIFLCNPRALFFFMCIKVSTILTCAPLIRKKFLFSEETFFPENLEIGEDIDLFFRLVRKGKTAFINEPLSFYRVYPQSITHRHGKNIYNSVASHVQNYHRNADFLSSLQRNAYRKRIASDLYDIAYSKRESYYFKKAFQTYLQSLHWHVGLPSFKGIIKTIAMSFLKRRFFLY